MGMFPLEVIEAAFGAGGKSPLLYVGDDFAKTDIQSAL